MSALVANAAPQIVVLPGMTNEDKARQKQIKDAWRGYRGEFDPILDKEEGTPDFNLYDNRMAPIVDKGVSWLFGEKLTITVQLSEGEEDTNAAAGDVQGTNDAQDWLNDALGDMDDFLTTLAEGALNGGVAGHVFWKIVPANPDAGQEYPRIVPLNSEIVWVETDPDDCKEVLAYNIQYLVKGPQNQDMLKRQRIARVDPDDLAGQDGVDDLLDTWTITNYLARDVNTNRWEQVGEVMPWVDAKGQPLHWPPIIDNPNLPNPNEFWGKPDLTQDILTMNRQVNLVQSMIAKLLWFYSTPILWSNLDSRQIMRARPGYVMGLGPNGQLNAIEAHGDVAASMQFVADLRSSMDEQSRVPAVALGRLQDMSMRPTSGIALRLLFQPLLEKTETKRRVYGRAIRDLCQRLLCLGGFGDGENLPIEIGWPNLIPVDDVQQLQGAILKQQLGYPLQTIMEELGDDYQEQMARKKAEDEASQDTFNAGGPAPEAQAFGQAPLPPEMQAMQQKMKDAAATPQEGAQ